MKKIVVIICLLLPLCLSAQKKHHFEAGLGYTMPAELLAEKLSTKESNTVCFYGEYRYDLTKAFSVGLQYGFVPNHSGEPLTSDVTQTAPEFTINTRYHSVNAVAEYRFFTSGSLTFFAALGGGAQYRYAKFSHSVDPRQIWSADLFVRAGLEIYDHLRISVGHCHDLHYPISALSTGAPYYFLGVGWSF